MPQLIFDITSFQRRFAKLASGIFLEQVKFGVWSENRSAAMASDHAPFRATLLQKQYNLLVVIRLQNDAISHIARREPHNRLAVPGN